MESKLQHSEDLLKLEKEKLQKERRESSEQMKALRADIKQWQDKLNRLGIQNWLDVFIFFSYLSLSFYFQTQKGRAEKRQREARRLKDTPGRKVRVGVAMGMAYNPNIGTSWGSVLSLRRNIIRNF